MAKKGEGALERLKDVHSLITEPGKKIAKAIYYPVSTFLNTGKNGKKEEEEKIGNIYTQKHNNITWLNVKNPSRKETDFLREKYSFHPLYLNTAISKSQPPQIEKEADYLFIVLHLPSYDSSENKVITHQVGIFLGKNYLITLHDENSPIFLNIFNQCLENKEYRDNFFKKTSGYLLYSILENLTLDMSSLAQTISQEIDEIEDIVFDVKSGAYKISQLRQKIIRLRRILGPWKNTLEDLSTMLSSVVGDAHPRYYGNLVRTVNRLRENIEEAKDTLEIYKDADYIVSSEKTNEILAVLTIIFTLTIPATIIGTFFGMNVLLPGGIEAGSWSFFGPYTTFIVVIGFSILMFLLMLWYFKIKDWF
jgi:magnesium transporter